MKGELIVGKKAFIFPGQGSQVVGMGKEFADMDESVKATFLETDECLGFSLSTLIFEGTQSELTLTYNAQPALVTTSIAFLRKLQDNIQADYVAGHSLGEYSALVAANVLSFSDAVYVVRKRGEFMNEAVPAGEGAMAAVLGMKVEDLQKVLDEVIEGNVVQMANINSPGQIVISGTKRGVELASERAKLYGAKRVIPLDVSGPFHSSLMKPAAERLQAVLLDIPFSNASVPVVTNVSATKVSDKKSLQASLVEQLYSPVQWEKSVERMIEDGVDTFIEIGPGKVLATLVKKINRSVRVFNVFDKASLLETIETLKGES